MTKRLRNIGLELSKPITLNDHDEIVPTYNYKYLDNTLHSFFAGDVYLVHFRETMFNHGIHRIGELVQLPEHIVFNIAPTSIRNKLKIKAGLKEVGLNFGMKAPGWRSTSRTTPLKIDQFNIA